MSNKNIELPIEELDYLISTGFKMIKKLIRRCRIKRIFKNFHKKDLYKYFINSYNSCKEITLEDSELLSLVNSGDFGLCGRKPRGSKFRYLQKN